MKKLIVWFFNVFLIFFFIFSTKSFAESSDILLFIPAILAASSPSCDSSHLNLCDTEATCIDAGGYWWSDNTCYGVAESSTVVSGGRVWMDRNLGASRVATSSTDSGAYGDLYQWGRGTDGHEKRNSPTTSAPSPSDNPSHGSFILIKSPPFDWRIPQNDNLWQGVSGVNNPCPAGFRLPTDTEWEAERVSWSSNDAEGAYGSPLKLVVAGIRDMFTGSIFHAGRNGYYWSGTVLGSAGNGFDSRYLLFGTAAAMSRCGHGYGYNVRCIKD